MVSGPLNLCSEKEERNLKIPIKKTNFPQLRVAGLKAEQKRKRGRPPKEKPEKQEANGWCQRKEGGRRVLRQTESPSAEVKDETASVKQETEKQINNAVDFVKSHGVENILALRGDPPEGGEDLEAPADDFSSALDLVSHIRRSYGSSLGLAIFAVLKILFTRSADATSPVKRKLPVPEEEDEDENEQDAEPAELKFDSTPEKFIDTIRTRRNTQ